MKDSNESTLDANELNRVEHLFELSCPALRGIGELWIRGIFRCLWISKEFRIPAIRTFPHWLDLILIQDDRIIDLTIYAMIM